MELDSSNDYYVVLTDFIAETRKTDVYLHSDSVREKYTYLHNAGNLTRSSFHNDPVLYRWYKVIRKREYPDFLKLAEKRLIVSMTSYPARISTVPKALETIYKQTRKADLVLLWLAEEQFPEGDKTFPDDLKQMAEKGDVTVRWCDRDIKPHKKYLYAMLEYPDDLIITVDDDLYYSETMIDDLFLSYLEYPEAVSAVRTHLIAMNEDNNILPYSDWVKGVNSLLNTPSMELFATGGAGTLYPPGVIRKEFLDPALVDQLCPIADDLWMKVIEVLNDVPVVQACPFDYLRYVEGTQDVGLVHVNVGDNKNDVQLKNIIDWAESRFGEKCIENGIISSKKQQFCGVYSVYKNALPFKSEAERLKTELKASNERKKELIEEIQKNAEKYKRFETELKEKNARFLNEIEINKQRAEDFKTKLNEVREQLKKGQEENERLKSELTRLQQQLDEMKESQSYKVGKAVTFLPRKLKEVIKNE